MAEENINNGTGTEGNEGGDGSQQETKTYTEEEVLKLIQAESDRRTNQALAKQKKEYEKKLSLSSLDEQQRKEAEAQMKIEELQSKLAAFQIEKNKSELKSIMAARNLDVRLADIINITDDLKESQQNIETLDKIFKECVRKEVEKRLAGNAPKGNGGNQNEITKETAKKMSLAELDKLSTEQPELYDKLFG